LRLEEDGKFRYQHMPLEKFLGLRRHGAFTIAHDLDHRATPPPPPPYPERQTAHLFAARPWVWGKQEYERAWEREHGIMLALHRRQDAEVFAEALQERQRQRAEDTILQTNAMLEDDSVRERDEERLRRAIKGGYRHVKTKFVKRIGSFKAFSSRAELEAAVLPFRKMPLVADGASKVPDAASKPEPTAQEERDKIEDVYGPVGYWNVSQV
ncbi:unnamed protein product, partial [Amoebophrya sp. A120]